MGFGYVRYSGWKYYLESCCRWTSSKETAYISCVAGLESELGVQFLISPKYQMGKRQTIVGVCESMFACARHVQLSSQMSRQEFKCTWGSMILCPFELYVK